MALYNHVNRGVFDGTPVLPPGCAVRPDPLANIEPDAPLSQWARGFADGHGWLEEAWDEYVPDDTDIDEELGVDLLVLSFFASREMAEAYRKEFPTLSQSLQELAGDALTDLPGAMRSYAHIGRTLCQATLTGREGERQEPVRREKIGRNDPCPCGSGRKYKKCCGVTLH